MLGVGLHVSNVYLEPINDEITMYLRAGNLHSCLLSYLPSVTACSSHPHSIQTGHFNSEKSSAPKKLKGNKYSITARKLAKTETKEIK